MTDKEVKLNWYAIAESGASMTAIHNLREHYSEVISELQKKSDTNHSLVEQLADKDIEIAELKEQIEKMKRCTNCKWDINGMSYEFGEPCKFCKSYSNWEQEDE